MDSLPSDIVIEIVKFVYPTELINICLAHSQFRYLGTDERLFRVLCTFEFQDFAEDWIFKLPEDWTWKQLFIELFNVKRQMISEMYTRVGLTYRYNYREIWGNGLKYFTYSGIIQSSGTLAERNEADIWYLSMLTAGVSKTGVCLPLLFNDERPYSLTVEDATQRRAVLRMISNDSLDHIVNSSTGDIWVDKMLLKKGFHVWHENLEEFVFLYPMIGVRNIFESYKAIIMKEYTEKFNSACKILNEEIHITYDCPDLVLKNYAEFQTEIEGIFRDHEWVVITYGYGYKGLSLLVSRYPKSMIFNKDNATDHDLQKFEMCQSICFNHLNESLNVTELLDYPTTHKPDIPKIVTLKANGKDGNPITLRLIESETVICQPRISHVKDNDNEFEDPLFGVDDNSTCEYDGPVDSDDSDEL
jgi:hypothetical protein